MKNGLRSQCKTCGRRDSRENRKKNIVARREYDDNYRVANRELLNEKTKIRYYKDIEKSRANGRRSRKKYYATHTEEIISKAAVYQRERLNADPTFRIICNLRRRLNHVIKDGYKSETTLALLGCTPKELTKYLEDRFTPEMSWDNYGSYWHVDHIKALSNFDLTKPEEQHKACHYTNLQPLSAVENIRKSNSL